MLRIAVSFFMVFIFLTAWRVHANDLEEIGLGYSAEIINVGTTAPSLQSGKSKFPVTVEVTKKDGREVEYFAFLSINGIPTAPFSFVLIGGPTIVRETFIWNVEIYGKEAIINFRLIGFDRDASVSYRIIDYSRTYSVIDEFENKKFHVVVKGDSLGKISKLYYGTTEKWRKIYEENIEVIGKNPNLISIGDRLFIPL